MGISSLFSPIAIANKVERILNSIMCRGPTHTYFDSEHLGDDLMIEILLKLPVKSVLRFRSLSKHWYNLTKTDYFITRYQHDPSRCHDNPSMIFLPSPYENKPDDRFNFLMVRVVEEKPVMSSLRLPALSFVKEIKEIRLIGASNGLVCLDMRFQLYPDEVGEVYEQVILVWNPATQQCKILPKFTNVPFDGDDKRSCYIPGCRRIVGFDFVHNDDDITINSLEYKVVRIFHHVEDVGVGNAYRAQVLDRSKNSWRMAKDFERWSPCESFPREESAITLNGVLYWNVLRRTSNKILMEYDCWVMSFDLRDEVFSSVIELPPDLRFYGDGNWNPSKYYSWRNSLAVLRRDFKTFWVMNNNNNNNNPVWTPMLILKDNIFQGILRKCFGNWKDDKFIFSEIVNDREVISIYDPFIDTKYVIMHGKRIDILYGVLNYVETLTPV